MTTTTNNNIYSVEYFKHHNNNNTFDIIVNFSNNTNLATIKQEFTNLFNFSLSAESSNINYSISVKNCGSYVECSLLDYTPKSGYILAWDNNKFNIVANAKKAKENAFLLNLEDKLNEYYPTYKDLDNKKANEKLIKVYLDIGENSSRKKVKESVKIQRLFSAALNIARYSNIKFLIKFCDKHSINLIKIFNKLSLKDKGVLISKISKYYNGVQLNNLNYNITLIQNEIKELNSQNFVNIYEYKALKNKLDSLLTYRSKSYKLGVKLLNLDYKFNLLITFNQNFNNSEIIQFINDYLELRTNKKFIYDVSKNAGLYKEISKKERVKDKVKEIVSYYPYRGRVEDNIISLLRETYIDNGEVVLGQNHVIDVLFSQTTQIFKANKPKTTKIVKKPMGLITTSFKNFTILHKYPNSRRIYKTNGIIRKSYSVANAKPLHKFKFSASNGINLAKNPSFSSLLSNTKITYTINKSNSNSHGLWAKNIKLKPTTYKNILFYKSGSSKIGNTLPTPQTETILKSKFYHGEFKREVYSSVWTIWNNKIYLSPTINYSNSQTITEFKGINPNFDRLQLIKENSNPFSAWNYFSNTWNKNYKNNIINSLNNKALKGQFTKEDLENFQTKYSSMLEKNMRRTANYKSPKEYKKFLGKLKTTNTNKVSMLKSVIEGMKESLNYYSVKNQLKNDEDNTNLKEQLKEINKKLSPFVLELSKANKTIKEVDNNSLYNSYVKQRLATEKSLQLQNQNKFLSFFDFNHSSLNVLKELRRINLAKQLSTDNVKVSKLSQISTINLKELNNKAKKVNSKESVNLTLLNLRTRIEKLEEELTKELKLKTKVNLKISDSQLRDLLENKGYNTLKLMRYIVNRKNEFKTQEENKKLLNAVEKSISKYIEENKALLRKHNFETQKNERVKATLYRPFKKKMLEKVARLRKNKIGINGILREYYHEDYSLTFELEFKGKVYKYD